MKSLSVCVPVLVIVSTLLSGSVFAGDWGCMKDIFQKEVCGYGCARGANNMEVACAQHTDENCVVGNMGPKCGFHCRVDIAGFASCEPRPDHSR